MNHIASICIVLGLSFLSCIKMAAQTSDLRFDPTDVDLGLSVNWADCNLGATTPEKYGTYFQWAETSAPYNHKYNEENCKTFLKDEEWLDENQYIVWNNAFPGDMSGRIHLQHDAAHKLWGNGWRLPSVKEWEELKRNTTIKPDEVNGIFGWRLTSKVEGYQDKSIFVPAAGYMGATPEDEACGEPTNVIIDSGTWAYFWTRDFYPTDDVTGRAWSIDSNDINGAHWYEDYRFFGFSIRPVKVKK